MITSKECALSYSRLFNISDATPLVAVAAAVNEIRSMCDAITTEVLTRSALLHAPACIVHWYPRCPHGVLLLQDRPARVRNMPDYIGLFQQIYVSGHQDASL